MYIIILYYIDVSLMYHTVSIRIIPYHGVQKRRSKDLESI